METVKQTSKTTANRQRLYLLLTVLIVMVIAVGLAFWAFFKAMNAETNVRYSGLQSIISAQLAKTIRGMELSAANVFNNVERHLDTPDHVVEALERESDLNMDVRGYFAAFEPDYFKEKGRWYEPYVHQTPDSKFEMTQVGSARHDYTKSDWYIHAKDTNGGFWSEPYYYYDGTNISGHYCTYVKPIFDANGHLVCVCGADVTLDWLSKELQKIDEACHNEQQMNKYHLWRDFDFYSVIIGSDGSCIVHPEGKNMPVKDEDVLKEMQARNTGAFEKIVNGEPSWVFYGPIEGIDWSVAVVASKADIRKPYYYVGGALILIIVIGMMIVWIVSRRIRE